MDTTDDIVCFEEGSDQPPLANLVTVSQEDMKHLQLLSDNAVIALERVGDTVSVSGTDRVGMIVLPSGRRVVIRSKIDSLVLLDWLSYLGEFPPLEMWLPDAGVTTGDDFHTCIARLFLYELEKVTRLHLRKDYTPVMSDGTTIRGRILTARLYQRLHQLPFIPQRYRTRTFDTRYNIVLAVALDRLPMLLRNAFRDDRRVLAVRSTPLPWLAASTPSPAFRPRAVASPRRLPCGSRWPAPPSP